MRGRDSHSNGMTVVCRNLNLWPWSDGEDVNDLAGQPWEVLNSGSWRDDCLLTTARPRPATNSMQCCLIINHMLFIPSIIYSQHNL